MSGRIRGHLRSNVIGYLALFFALSGTAVALDGTNTVFTDDIVNGEVRTADLQEDSVNGNKLRDDSTASRHVVNNTLQSEDVLDGSLTGTDIADSSLAAADLGTDSVGSSEIAADVVGSSEIAPGVVGADELISIHEHFGPATDIVDGTAHDGSYATSTSTVSCGVGEDLLSVSIDWTDRAGHNEVVTSGVESITRGEPDAATVRVAFDGGAGPATYQAVATCIF